MATRIAARYISRRLSSCGKVLSEKEKAAGNVNIKGPKPSETPAGSVADAKPSGGASSAPNAPNVYIKKMEQGKLDKLAAAKGPKPSETPAADAKPSDEGESLPDMVRFLLGFSVVVCMFKAAGIYDHF